MSDVEQAKTDLAAEKPTSYRGATSDWHDPHRAWTNQSGDPFPAVDATPSRVFNPAELPDPAVVEEAGFKPLNVPDFMVKEGYETQPPSDAYPVDHPARDENRGQAGITALVNATPDRTEADDRISAASPGGYIAPPTPPAIGGVTDADGNAEPVGNPDAAKANPEDHAGEATPAEVHSGEAVHTGDTVQLSEPSAPPA